MPEKNPSSQSDLSPTPRPVVRGKKRRISSSSSSHASGDALNQAFDMGEEEEEEDELPEWYRMLWKCIYNDPRNEGLSYEEMELVFARVLKRTKLPLYDEDERKPQQTEKNEDKTMDLPRRKDLIAKNKAVESLKAVMSQSTPLDPTKRTEDWIISQKGASGDDADVSLNNSKIQLGLDTSLYNETSSEDSLSITIHSQSTIFGSGLSLNVPLTPRAFEDQVSSLNSSNSSSDVEMRSETPVEDKNKEQNCIEKLSGSQEVVEIEESQEVNQEDLEEPLEASQAMVLNQDSNEFVLETPHFPPEKENPRNEISNDGQDEANVSQDSQTIENTQESCEYISFRALAAAMGIQKPSSSQRSQSQESSQNLATTAPPTSESKSTQMPPPSTSKVPRQSTTQSMKQFNELLSNELSSQISGLSLSQLQRLEEEFERHTPSPQPNTQEDSIVPVVFYYLLSLTYSPGRHLIATVNLPTLGRVSLHGDHIRRFFRIQSHIWIQIEQLLTTVTEQFEFDFQNAPEPTAEFGVADTIFRLFQNFVGSAGVTTVSVRALDRSIEVENQDDDCGQLQEVSEEIIDLIFDEEDALTLKGM